MPLASVRNTTLRNQRLRDDFTNLLPKNLAHAIPRTGRQTPMKIRRRIRPTLTHPWSCLGCDNPEPGPARSRNALSQGRTRSQIENSFKKLNMLTRHLGAGIQLESPLTSEPAKLTPPPSLSQKELNSV